MVSIATYSPYDEYQNSGAQWLGEVPKTWELTRLGTRFIERRTKVSDIDYPALSVTKQGILPQLENAAKTKDGDNRKLVKAGDFVINSRSDRKGSSGVSDRDGSVSLINIVLEPKGIHPKYSQHLLKSYAFIEEYYRVGRGIVADLWTTRYDEMRTVTIAVPSYEEQTAIANFLDKKTAQIDEAIAIKEKQIELLKERKQIIIQQAVTQGLNPDAPMKDSGVDWIGEIPEHWALPKLKLISEFVNDGTHGSYPRVEDGYRLLSVRNIINNKFVFRDDDSRVSYKHFKEISSKFQVAIGDIQLAIVGATLGKVAVVDDLPEEIVTQRSVSTIRVKKSKCSNKFVAYFMRSEAFQSYLWNNAGFSAQPGVYLNTIQNAYIPLPSLGEQLEIVNLIELKSKSIDEALDIQFNQIEKLKEYKTTLINSAVTGKIKVPEVDSELS